MVLTYYFNLLLRWLWYKCSVITSYNWYVNFVVHLVIAHNCCSLERSIYRRFRRASTRMRGISCAYHSSRMRSRGMMHRSARINVALRTDLVLDYSTTLQRGCSATKKRQETTWLTLYPTGVRPPLYISGCLGYDNRISLEYLAPSSEL